MPQARTDCIHYTTTQTYLYEDFVGVGWEKKDLMKSVWLSEISKAVRVKEEHMWTVKGVSTTSLKYPISVITAGRKLGLKNYFLVQRNPQKS